MSLRIVLEECPEEWKCGGFSGGFSATVPEWHKRNLVTLPGTSFWTWGQCLGLGPVLEYVAGISVNAQISVSASLEIHPFIPAISIAPFKTSPSQRRSRLHCSTDGYFIGVSRLSACTGNCR